MIDALKAKCFFLAEPKSNRLARSRVIVVVIVRCISNVQLLWHMLLPPSPPLNSHGYLIRRGSPNKTTDRPEGSVLGCPSVRLLMPPF